MISASRRHRSGAGFQQKQAPETQRPGVRAVRSDVVNGLWMYYHLVTRHKELGGSSGKMMTFQGKSYTAGGGRKKKKKKAGGWTDANPLVLSELCKKEFLLRKGSSARGSGVKSHLLRPHGTQQVLEGWRGRSDKAKCLPTSSLGSSFCSYSLPGFFPCYILITAISSSPSSSNNSEEQQFRCTVMAFNIFLPSRAAKSGEIVLVAQLRAGRGSWKRGGDRWKKGQQGVAGVPWKMFSWGWSWPWGEKLRPLLGAVAGMAHRDGRDGL